MAEAIPPASDHPHVHLPPPLVYLTAMLAGWALQRVAPLPAVPWPVAKPIGWLLLAGWAVFTFGGIAMFLGARTTPLPMRPARALVEGGMYRFSRNPMYVGMAMLQAAIGLFWRLPWVLVMLLPAIALIDVLVIRNEERYLERRFGAEYEAYRARVRRWL